MLGIVCTWSDDDFVGFCSSSGCGCRPFVSLLQFQLQLLLQLLLLLVELMLFAEYRIDVVDVTRMANVGRSSGSVRNVRMFGRTPWCRAHE